MKKMTFGETLKNLRHLKLLSLRELGKKTGINYVTLCRYENGNSENPNLKMVKKLAKFFDVDINVFFS